MGDRTDATLVLYVPEGGIRAGIAAALGADSELPEWLTEDADVQQVLLQGGTITVEDGEANYGRVHGWGAAEWSGHLGGIDVDASWRHGSAYGPGAEFVRAGKEYERAELDGEAVVSESWLRRMLESGSSLAQVLEALAIPAVGYAVGPLKAELNV